MFSKNSRIDDELGIANLLVLLFVIAMMFFVVLILVILIVVGYLHGQSAKRTIGSLQVPYYKTERPLEPPDDVFDVVGNVFCTL